MRWSVRRKEGVVLRLLRGEALEKPLNAWGQNVVLACACAVVAVRVLTGGAPGCWPLLAAIAVWTLGNLWWGFVLYGLDEPPFPSPADAGWLAFYPCAYLCLGLRLRASARDLPRSAWLDGLVGILSVGAVGVTLVVAPVLAGAEGTRAAVLTNAAYPLADVLLLAFTIAVLVLHGWRSGRAWALLAVGFGLFAVADSVYLSRLAADSYSAGTVLDSLWVVALVIMALASWQPLERPRDVDPGHLGVLVPPLLFSIAALALLVYAGLGHVPGVAVALAGAAVLAAMVRTLFTVREIRGFHEARRQAATADLPPDQVARRIHLGPVHRNSPRRRRLDRRYPTASSLTTDGRSLTATTATDRASSGRAVLMTELQWSIHMASSGRRHGVLGAAGPRRRPALAVGMVHAGALRGRAPR